MHSIKLRLVYSKKIIKLRLVDSCENILITIKVTVNYDLIGYTCKIDFHHPYMEINL